MISVSSPGENASQLDVNVALCVEREALDRLGAMFLHLVVGLVDHAIPLRLISSDEQIERLRLGPVHCLTHPPITWPFAAQRIDALLSDLQRSPPVVTHAFAFPSYRKAWTIADACDSELVVTVTSIADAKHLADFDLDRVRTFIALSTPLVRALCDQTKLSAQRVVCIPPGVKAKEHACCFSQQRREPTVFCTAPFDKHGGVDLLIDAVYRLSQEHHAVLLFLLGEGNRESRLRKLVQSRNLGSKVTFANLRGDVTDLMGSADLFVNTQGGSALNIDGLRAMGAGMAVVAFEDNVCDHFKHERTALVCAERSADELVRAMRRLIDDHEFARALADKSVAYVRAHHSMSGMGDAMANIYRGLALNRATFPIGE